jgi:hypothetical protein
LLAKLRRLSCACRAGFDLGFTASLTAPCRKLPQGETRGFHKSLQQRETTGAHGVGVGSPCIDLTC